MSREKAAAARLLRAKGQLLREIADELSISVRTASNYCKGVLPRGSHAVGPSKVRSMERFAQMYRAGQPIPEISVSLGIPPTTLYDWRRQMGLKRNSRKLYVTDELRQRIAQKMTVDPDGKLVTEAVRLYVEEELATPEIAEKLGVTNVTVGEWLRRSGVVTRRSPTIRTREKLRKANLGENRYNWKGGITGEQRRKRLSMYMREAREACFQRDEYTCRSCSQRGGKLNAHHIWPFQRFSQWMYETWNLVTLCKQCHDEFHKAAGGHVKIAIGPFFDADDDTQIKEDREFYTVRPMGRYLEAINI